MEIIGIVVLLAHAGVAAVWLGAMTYSLFVVRPRLVSMVGEDPERVERAQQELARGNRWPTVAILATLLGTGVALVALRGGGPGWWWALTATKTALLAAAGGVFWWVSWRAWPRRVFALPDELPALRSRFHAAALTMAALVACAFALGVVQGGTGR